MLVEKDILSFQTIYAFFLKPLLFFLSSTRLVYNKGHSGFMCLGLPHS